MNDNVKVLFPDKPSLVDEPSPAEVLAANLEECAVKIRSGEMTAQYGLFVYLDHDTRVRAHVIGDSTYHQHVALLEIAKSLVLTAMND